MEVGFCQCGCGGKTQRITQDEPGRVAGEFSRFLRGHSQRVLRLSSAFKGGRYISTNGYVMLWVPKLQKYRQEHILIVERVMGKSLPAGAVVHHINENRLDNRPENLLVCARAYHQLIHRRLRALKASGNPNWRKCTYCKRYDAPENLNKRGNAHGACRQASYMRSR